MAKYSDLKKRVQILERAFYLKDKEIIDAHEMCDKLDVQNSESGALIGHRLLWYSEGKRQSNKTKENTEGYSQEEWDRRKQSLKDITERKHTFAPTPKLPIVS